VAVRVTGDPDPANNGLFYLYSDHHSASSGQALGSASAMTDAAGNLVGNVTRYLPFGGYRMGSGPNEVTDRGFTGQKENMDLGLMYYNARYYIPYLNRFISADTIVPDPTNPQSFNRYSYVRNNPLNRIDPTGHIDCALLPAGECSNSTPGLISFDIADGVDEVWNAAEMGAIYQGAYDLGSAYARDINSRSQGDFSRFGDNEYTPITPEEAFMSIYGGSVSFEKRGVSCSEATGDNCYAQTQTSRSIYVFTDIYDDDDISKIPRVTTSNRWAVHELGHAFESRVNGKIGTWGYVRDQLPDEVLNRNGFAGAFPGWQQSTNNYGMVQNPGQLD